MYLPDFARSAAVTALIACLFASRLAAQFGPGDIDGACSCVPGLNDLQQTEVTRIEEAAEVPLANAKSAEKDILAAAFTDRPDSAQIKAAVDALAAAELQAALLRADAFARMQSGPQKLSSTQIDSLIQFRARGGPAGRGGPGFPGGAGAGGAGRGRGGAAPARGNQ